jgi:hypothetical protein
MILEPLLLGPLDLQEFLGMIVRDLHSIKGVFPPVDKYVGREVRDYKTHEIRYARSKWANPFPLKVWGPNALFFYGLWILSKMIEDPVIYDLRELFGHNLDCWCVRQKWYTPGSCHGFALLRFIAIAREGEKKCPVPLAKRKRGLDFYFTDNVPGNTREQGLNTRK